MSQAVARKAAKENLNIVRFGDITPKVCKMYLMYFRLVQVGDISKKLPEICT